MQDLRDSWAANRSPHDPHPESQRAKRRAVADSKELLGPNCEAAALVPGTPVPKTLAAGCLLTLTGESTMPQQAKQPSLRPLGHVHVQAVQVQVSSIAERAQEANVQAETGGATAKSGPQVSGRACGVPRPRRSWAGVKLAA